MTMGLTKLPAMVDHWRTDEHHDYPAIRRCMSRDLFGLIYGRFLHFAVPKRAAKDTREDEAETGSRGAEGGEGPPASEEGGEAHDKMHHVR